MFLLGIHISFRDKIKSMNILTGAVNPDAFSDSSPSSISASSVPGKESIFTKRMSKLEKKESVGVTYCLIYELI